MECGLFTRGDLVRGFGELARQYMPVGPVEAAFEVNAHTDSGWEHRVRGVRHLPPDCEAEAVTAIAEQWRAQGQVRVVMTAPATPDGLPVLVWADAPA